MPIHHTSYQELSLLDKALIDKAVSMTDYAYAPYSGFLVGAAVQLSNGVVMGGCNQENASYPLCMCGERVALYSASAVHPNIGIDSLAIVARNPKNRVTKPISPCGACRQVIAEYESRSGVPIRIILKGETDPTVIINGIKALLPYGFDDSFSLASNNCKRYFNYVILWFTCGKYYFLHFQYPIPLRLYDS